MGHFVAFNCDFCHYREPEPAVGRGRDEFPLLKLFRCNHCKTIGSTWIFPRTSGSAAVTVRRGDHPCRRGA